MRSNYYNNKLGIYIARLAALSVVFLLLSIANSNYSENYNEKVDSNLLLFEEVIVDSEFESDDFDSAVAFDIVPYVLLSSSVVELSSKTVFLSSSDSTILPIRAPPKSLV